MRHKKQWIVPGRNRRLDGMPGLQKHCECEEKSSTVSSLWTGEACQEKVSTRYNVSGNGIRLHKSRLFRTMEEARNYIEARKGMWNNRVPHRDSNDK